jgi:hypothetical protein
MSRNETGTRFLSTLVAPSAMPQGEPWRLETNASLPGKLPNVDTRQIANQMNSAPDCLSRQTGAEHGLFTQCATSEGTC